MVIKVVTNEGDNTHVALVDMDAIAAVAQYDTLITFRFKYTNYAFSYETGTIENLDEVLESIELWRSLRTPPKMTLT